MPSLDNIPIDRMIDADKFKIYIYSSLPDEYPIDDVNLSLNMTSDHRKELMFQQNKFLQRALSILERLPWISFIAAFKHKVLLNFFNTDSATFSEIVDKEYFDNLQTLCNKLIQDSSLLIQEELRGNCERLVFLQVVNSHIVKSIEAVQGALDLGYTYFEPCATEPAKYSRNNFGQVPTTIAVLLYVYYLIAYVSEGDSDKSVSRVGMATVILLVSTIAIQFFYKKRIAIEFKKEAESIFEIEKYKNYLTFRSIYFENITPLESLLNFDSKTYSKDLKKCLFELKKLLTEKDTLQGHLLIQYL